MADDDLEAIRARRMAELQSQQGHGDGAKAQAEQQARENEMKNVILGQVLDQSARARLNTIAIAKPEKARMVENLIIQMARTGQLQGQKLSEAQLKDLLEQVSSSTQKKTTVKFDRRRAHMDDSDEDF
ncbi:Programmed cell death protein 5 [Biomphalaria glabrata]|uniref:Programmed cell death protein 5 n=2 Tax=Biomphalaria TaxID=6525 RepID=A0A9W3AZ01_BIOGL|nr:programmed cell death protein 5-like [Biomphalaria glabrata]KAI8762799.1 programmed cell death protein 5-like [Biomphalaria glabrata]KAI8790560.1 programmed cell death protein 5 [Biomphalaria glabrata]KAK0045921.1 programmed cell death protein 5 [Biomphalaria pfeifferi]